MKNHIKHNFRMAEVKKTGRFYHFAIKKAIDESLNNVNST